MQALLFAEEIDNPSDRIPSFTFDNRYTDSTFGIFLPSVACWVQLLLMLTISQFLVVIIAGIVYYVIIPNRGDKTTTAFPYLIGFGIVIPLCLTFPFWIINILGMRNHMLRFSAFTFLPITCMFQCMEAMFGFSPYSVEASFRNYALYYTSPAEIVFDKKTHMAVTASRADIMSKVRSFVYYILMTGTYKSILHHVEYRPFESNINTNTTSSIGLELFHGIFDWKLLLNNLILTILFHMYLSTFTVGLCLIPTMVLRVRTIATMDNPLMMSTSPSDFWGRRWNLIIHGSLKRGVFMPVYRYSSKFIAVWITFIVSGLFHEYLIIGACLECPRNFGKQTAFFIWNAFIVTLEHFLGNASIFQWIKNNVPKPVITALVLSTAMPVAHWFLHPYTNIQMFEHGEVIFPMVLLI